MNVRGLLIFALILALLPCGAVAGTTGKISGRVTEAGNGEPVVGVNVYIKDRSLGGTTDTEGYFFILNVPPGTYAVTASSVGHRPETRKSVLVQVDRTTDLSFALESEAVLADEIVVEAQRPAVQRDQTSTAQAVDGQQLEALPVNTLQGALQLQTGVVFTDGLHLRGGRTGEVAYYLDGYKVEDALFNDDPLQVNNQAIEQMELLSGTFNAEYGNALSGVVNVVTKENFDRIRANLTYKRTKWGFDGSSNDLNERYYEGYVTGPLWQGSPVGLLLSGKKVNADNYYYSGTSRTRFDSSGSIVRESDEFSRDKPFGYDDFANVLGKVYLRPFASGRATLIYNYSNREWQSYDHVLRFIPDSSYIRSSSSELLGANISHTPSEALFYEVRLSYYRFTYLRHLGSMHYTQYPVPLFLRFDNSRFYRSAANSGYEDQATKTYTAKGDMTFQADRFNLVKAGFDVRLHDMDYFNINNPNNPNARFLVEYNYHPQEFAVYAQDKIEFQSIILNLGLRYDVYSPRASYLADPFDPASVTQSSKKSSWSPRIGIAYPVRDNMVFHFAYGQFFQRPEYQVMYDNLARTFPQDEPLFGNPDLKPERTASYEFGLHTTLGANATIQTTVFSKKIQNLVGVAWEYQPLAYASYVNEDFATVNGFEISARWNNRNVALRADYTFSSAQGSSSSQQERYSGAFDIVGTQSLVFLPLDFDQRHTLNGQVHLSFGKEEGPFGFLPDVFENANVDIVLRYGSGLPFTYNPERARYVADRNNSRLPATLVVDLLVRKDFPVGPVTLGIFADVRNLFNRKNVRAVYAATGSPVESGSTLKNTTPDYEQDPTNFYAPRTIYLGVNIGI